MVYLASSAVKRICSSISRALEICQGAGEEAGGSANRDSDRGIIHHPPGEGVPFRPAHG